MPAYLGGELQIAGIKWIPSKPSNPQKYGLPRANALIILNDPETLFPLAVMDGTIISAMRTGAASGVAAKYLALPQSRALGMVGAGVQMRTQAMAMKVALPELREGWIFDINSAKSEAFAREMAETLGITIHVAATAEEACAGRDVFITATMSSFAYIQKEWYKPGALHCEVSFWDTPAEVLVSLDVIVCDDYHAVQHHGVDVAYRAVRDGHIRREQVVDLGDVIIGKAAGRTQDQQKIIFNPIGMGIHDVSEAYRIYRTAKAKGIGRVLPLWEAPHWR
jgi:ornithine cyclodeaminase